MPSDYIRPFPRTSSKTRSAASPVPSKESPEVDALAAPLIEYHQRELKLSELGVLRSIVTLWKRGEKRISHYALNDLGITNAEGRNFLKFENPLDIEELPPASSPEKLWQYIAHFAKERKFGLPSFMAPLNHSDEVHKQIHRLRRSGSIEEWRYVFKKETSSDIRNAPAGVSEDTLAPPTMTFPAEIRLRFSVPKLVWDLRENPDSPWRVSRTGEAKFWFNAFADGDHPLAPGSPLFALFSQITALYYHERHVYGATSDTRAISDIQTIRLEDRRAQRLLRWLLLTPELKDLLVTADGEPFRSPPVRLVWRAEPETSDTDDIVFQLADLSGTTVKLNDLVVFDKLEKPPFLAVRGDTVYLRPGDFPGRHLQSGGELPAVPYEVLVTPEAVLWMKKNAVDTSNLNLPEIQTIFQEIVYKVHVDLKESGVPDRLLVRLLARDATGKHVHEYTDGQWIHTTAKSTAANAAFLGFDRPPTDAAERHLLRLELLWEAIAHAYSRRFTLSLLDDLVAWFRKARQLDIELEIDPLLEGLARDPDTASLEIDFTQDSKGGGSNIDWFDLKVAFRPSETDLTQEELNLLLRANGRFVNLPGKGFRRLNVLRDKERCESLRELGIEPDAITATAEHHRFHTLQLADERIIGLLSQKHAAQVRERAARLHTIARPPVPTGLTASLRPYQVEGFHFLAHLAENNLGGILADDMGLGKTVQTLAWLLWIQKNKTETDETKSQPAENKSQPGTAKPKTQLSDAKTKNQPGEAETKNKSQISNFKSQIGEAASLRALVVCPKSVVPNWRIETGRFAPTLTTATLNFDTVDTAALVPTDANIIVVNYAQLRNNLEALSVRPWDAVILDEGQNIKNPGSLSATSARALPAHHRIILTGTPIENRLLDLWSLFSFAMPGLLGTQASFKRFYNDKTDSTFARSRLASRTRHFMLRRTKTQVAPDLPPRIEEDLYVELEGPQRQLYDAEVKRARLALLNIKTARQFDLARFNILQSLLRLRQICCHPALIGFKDAKKEAAAAAAAATATATVAVTAAPKRRGRPPKVAAVTATTAPDTATAFDADEDSKEEIAAETSSAKLDALIEQIEPIVEEGHRILVFSQFVSMLELIHDELAQRGIKHLMLTGKTENRQELVEKFQSKDGPPVFLLSLKAAGSGLNLTAASYVFLFDPWWNPAVEAQAIDRTHRIGQKSRVIACRLLAKDTVEEKIRQLQHQKAALASDVVQEETLATVLNLDDLRFVLS